MLSEGLLTWVVRRQSWTLRLPGSMVSKGRLETLSLLLLLLLPSRGDIWGIKQVGVEVFLEIVIARLVGSSCIILYAAEEAGI